jgi:uncharacterized membrane protein YhhN
MNLLLPVVCLFACSFALWAEANNQNKLNSKGKFLASLAFVAYAWDLGAVETVYGQVLLLGLVLCLIGDVLLSLHGRSWSFLLGIVAFLLAHIAYATAFSLTGFTPEKLPLILPVALIFLLMVFLWLRKYLTGKYMIAVPAYLLAIGCMLVFAWCNQSITAWWWIVTGASLFALSDLLVARNRFIKTENINRIIGLPIYYLAQLLLAYTTALV